MKTWKCWKLPTFFCFFRKEFRLCIFLLHRSQCEHTSHAYTVKVLSIQSGYEYMQMHVPSKMLRDLQLVPFSSLWQTVVVKIAQTAACFSKKNHSTAFFWPTLKLSNIIIGSPFECGALLSRQSALSDVGIQTGGGNFGARTWRLQSQHVDWERLGNEL